MLTLPVNARAHGAFHEVFAELTTQLKETPNDAELMFKLAVAYCEHDDWPEALSTLERVEKAAPGRFSTDLIRGRANLGAGRATEAEGVLNRFLAANPNHTEALTLRARANARLGRRDASLKDYRAALAASKNANVDLVLEVSDALVSRRQSQEAIKVLAEAIERLGPEPSLALKAMSLEAEAGQFDAAISRIDIVQKTAPRPEPWMAKRATLLTQAGRTAEAHAAWQTLAAHLTALPPLERGSREMTALAEEARRALGTGPAPTPVSAPPASKIPVSVNSSKP